MPDTLQYLDELATTFNLNLANAAIDLAVADLILVNLGMVAVEVAKNFRTP